MAGVSDGPFRRICQELGAGLTVSELASAKGLVMGLEPTREMIDFQGQLRPYAVQIFGACPETMGRAAAIVEEMKICDIIDINMGCPVSKVVKTGAGAALMKTPELAERIIKSVVKSVTLPVTVKCRIGWKAASSNLGDFVRMAVESGASGVTVHARTKEDGYSGKARWEALEGLQDICGKIPLIANGDIRSLEDIKKIHAISGCRGFMIGRGAVGKPWIFSELLGNNKNGGELSPTEKFGIFRKHLVEMLMEHGPKGVPLFRVHLFAYLRGHPFAAQIRRNLCYEMNPHVVLGEGEKFFNQDFADMRQKF